MKRARWRRSTERSNVMASVCSVLGFGRRDDMSDLNSLVVLVVMEISLPSHECI